MGVVISLARSHAWKLTAVLADIGPSKFLFPTTFDCIEPAGECSIGDIQPVDILGNVLPELASSSTPQVPKYLVGVPDKDFSRAIDKKRGFPDYNDDENQVKMIGIDCLSPMSERPVLSCGDRHQAPELVLEGQLTPKADIWSLGCLVCD